MCIIWNPIKQQSEPISSYSWQGIPIHLHFPCCQWCSMYYRKLPTKPGTFRSICEQHLVGLRKTTIEFVAKSCGKLSQFLTRPLSVWDRFWCCWWCWSWYWWWNDYEYNDPGLQAVVCLLGYQQSLFPSTAFQLYISPPYCIISGLSYSTFAYYVMLN